MEKRQETLLVKTYHCRPDGRMKIHVLMHRLQEIAAARTDPGSRHPMAQRDGLLLGSEQFRNGNRPDAPVGRDSNVADLAQRPQPPHCHAREFMGHAADGSELLRAGSQWMILNRKTGRPINHRQTHPPLPGDAEKVISPSLERWSRPQTANIRKPSACLTAIDMNGHVNNTEYVRWGMDVLRARRVHGPRHAAASDHLPLRGIRGRQSLNCPALAVGLAGTW